MLRWGKSPLTRESSEERSFDKIDGSFSLCVVYSVEDFAAYRTLLPQMVHGVDTTQTTKQYTYNYRG